jgi:hypothetical protein
MGKKNTTNTNPAAPVKRAAKPATKNKVAVAENGAAPSPAPKAVAKPKGTRKPVFTESDVALRAYFIAEKRRANGLPGDEHQDWIDAEQQLQAESAAPRRK